MATEVKRLIQVRVDKGASFKRDGYGKKRQLSDSWRKPRGQHNKQREQKKAKGALPKPGYGSPIAVRGMHPSGFFEVLVSTIKELEGLDPKTQAVRIAATVGDKKRVALQEAALGKGLKVLNARTVKAKAPAKKPAAEKKPAEKKAPAKKAAAKPKAETAGKPAEKKAPAKKAAAKPKAETADKPAEKKAPAKKAAAKPKAETADKPAEKKAPAKKTTKSGVKKNE
ncbi:MAG: 50S ribosomal protein L32e [Methanoregula sp.]|jgi:large subunit ribosomal protein L32e|nr:50S ribosomal protein L32e [Methanoregula sp.]